MKNIFKMCVNWKVLLGVGVVILLAYLFVPQLASYSWILLALACPLSMVFMMAAMNHDDNKSERLFVCPECGFSYKDAEWAKKCAAWCKEHHSCNLEITKHAVEQIKK
jgi:hypothetical protein